jgi:hypothetical protein
MLEFACRIALGVNVGDFLQLQRAFHGGEVDAAPKIKYVPRAAARATALMCFSMISTHVAGASISALTSLPPFLDTVPALAAGYREAGENREPVKAFEATPFRSVSPHTIRSRAIVDSQLTMASVCWPCDLL